MTVSEIKAGKGKGRVGPAAMPRVTRQTSPLTYHGYPVQELCWRHSFEEVAFLLWHGELPTRDQLLAQNRAERSRRALGLDLATALAGQPMSADPVDTLRKAVRALGADVPAGFGSSPAAVHAQVLRLFAVLPSLVACAQRCRRGLDAVPPRDDLGYAANFLYMTFGKVPEPQVVAAFERSLILHAGDSFDDSPLAARIGSSSLPVLYNTVAAAVGALAVGAHGPAAEAVPEILNEAADSGNARTWAEQAVATGRRVAGFDSGAAKASAAKAGDGRVGAMRTALGMAAALRGGQRLLDTYEALASAMDEVSGLRPTLDFPTGLAYHLIGFDPQLFIPVLVAARFPGVTAHLAGQPRVNGIIRPRASYDDQSAGRRAVGG